MQKSLNNWERLPLLLAGTLCFPPPFFNFTQDLVAHQHTAVIYDHAFKQNFESRYA